MGRITDAMDWFATALGDTDPRRAVPSCPGWNVYDLAVHIGNVHAWAATVVETGAAAPWQNDAPADRRPGTLADWYGGKAADLLEVLRITDPESPCWGFGPGLGAAGFWFRRQLHETLVHSYDLAATRDEQVTVHAALAADGVDEVLRVFLPQQRTRGRAVPLTAPLSVVARDLGRAWTLRPGRLDAVPTQQAPAEVSEGAAAEGDRIEADAQVLYWLLWGRQRREDATMELQGDLARIAAFLDAPLTA